MAYEKTNWKNREVERPRTFEVQDNSDGTITLVPSEGNIIEEGTPIIAKNMNNIEAGIESAIEDLGEHKADYMQYKQNTEEQLKNTKGSIVSNLSRTEIDAIGQEGLKITNEYLQQVNASSNCAAIGTHSSTGEPRYSQVNASYNSIASGNVSQVNASDSSTASEFRSQVNASDNSTASKSRSQVNVSSDSIASGIGSQVNVSSDSIASGIGSQVNVSSNTMNDKSYSSVWGFSPSGIPSTQNRKVEISSRNGTIRSSGAITGNSSFADFAEYFESENGESIPLGTIVSLGKGGKIKTAQSGDYMVGIISQTAGVILNAQGFEWKDRYLYDRYGQPILVEREIENKETGELEIVEAPMLNDSWNENEEYIAREDRKEWNVVGLTGQIFVNVDNTVQGGDFIEVGENGIATKGRNEYSQNWQVMKITTPYQEELGFGIAVAFVR